MTNPHPDIFDTLLSSSISSDIALFVESHRQFAMVTNEPAYALQHRFPVDAIGINKAGLPAQHESLAIWVSDRKTLKHHEFVIEQVPSDWSYTSRFAAFSQCPDSKMILTSIECYDFPHSFSFISHCLPTFLYIGFTHIWLLIHSMLTQALIHALPMRLFMRLFIHSLLTHGQPYCTVYKDRVDTIVL